MTSFVSWVLTALVAGCIGFAVVAVITGRTDPMAPMPPDATPLDLPPDRPVSPGDLEALRFDLAFRGYRMSQVDAALQRLSTELAERDARIAELVMRERPGPDRV